jgi:hypothetical protein
MEMEMERALKAVENCEAEFSKAMPSQEIQSLTRDELLVL